MTPDTISKDLCTRFPAIIPTTSWGETSFFFNPAGLLKRGVYFATIKEKDGENDRASNLDRANVWRFNLGIPPKAFEARFGARPARPGKGDVIEGRYDFTAQDILMPHPVYGWMGWVAILCPSQASYAELSDFIELAFQKALATAKTRIKKEALQWPLSF